MSIAPALVLREGDRDRLAELTRLPSVSSGLAKRARVVLLAANGMPNAQIARATGVSRPTVIGWRDRYEQGGIKALQDEPRSGGRRRSTSSRSWPRRWPVPGGRHSGWGITHWSSRFLAAELSISFAMVARRHASAATSRRMRLIQATAGRLRALEMRRRQNHGRIGKPRYLPSRAGPPCSFSAAAISS